ncbi:MAG: DUF350 domain-containing protein [Nitrospinota bacterium]
MEYTSEYLAVIKNSVFFFEVLFFLLLAKWVYSKISQFSFLHELTEKDNLAFSITLIGYLSGVAIILLGIISEDSSMIELATLEAAKTGKLQEMPNMFLIQISDVAVYSMLGIILLLLSRVVSDRFLLPHFSIYKEIIEDKNAGTGVVLFASFISTALIINASLSGEGSAFISCIVFFIIGQAILILFTRLYQFITPFDIHDEIEKDNVAVGCSFAGTLLGIGILVSKGITGEFDGFADLLLSLTVYTLVGFVLFPVVRLAFDRIFIPGVDLSKELTHDRNTGLGLLEGFLAIIVALTIYFTM